MIPSCLSTQYLESLLCGYSASARKSKRILMLTLYCDDSGTNYKTPFCVLAGYIAYASEWASFSEEWDRELHRAPALPYLKMAQAFSLKDTFQGWSEAERNNKLKNLAKVIKGHELAGIASFVGNEAYKSFVKGYVPKTVDHPYWLCYSAVVLGAFGYVPGKDKINFVFDRQGVGFERRAGFHFDAFADPVFTQQASRFGMLSFADGDQLAPLQAAEMLAWSVRNHCDQSSRLEDSATCVSDILWSMPVIAKPWDGAAMADALHRGGR